MRQVERVFHSLLFELIAVVMLTFFFIESFNQNNSKASILAIATSTIAMVWNYFYNIAFDFKFGHERIKRSFIIRCIHAIGFEVGIMILTVPVLMWSLGLDLVSVIILDIGLMLFFLVYSLVFNYLYDHIRFKVCKHNI